MNNNLKYFLLYAVCSIGLLSYSTISSLKASTDFTTFLLEFTDGFKLVILINFMVISIIVSNKLLQLLIFGELRIIEVEHLVEKLPVFTINLFFNLATSDNNLILNSFLMGLSIGFKVFHIIITDRLDLMNMKIVNNMSEDTTKSRVLYQYLTCFNFWLNLVLIVLDFSVAKFLVYDVFQGINSVTCLLFGFQFAVQGVDAMTYYSKMLLNVYELVEYRSTGSEEEENEDSDLLNEDDDEKVWENKPFYSKGIDISSSSLKALSHLCFIYLLTFHSGLSLPLSMLQGTYSSIRQTYLEVSELLAFIESSKMLDKKLPNATKEDLAESDNLCIICREDMFSVEDYEEQFKKRLSVRRCPKKLVCGHILHMGCLKEWMERSESCPLCRRKVFEANQPGETGQHTPTPGAPPPATMQAQFQERLRDFTDMLHRQPPAEPTGNEGGQNVANEEQVVPNEAPPLTNHIQRPTPTTTHVPTPTSTRTSSVPTPVPSPFIPTTIETRSFPEQNIVDARLSSDTLAGYQEIALPSTALLPPDWTLIPLSVVPLEERQDGNEGEYKIHYSTLAEGRLTIKKRNMQSPTSILRRG